MISGRGRRVRLAATLSLLFVFGLLVNLYYGRIGFMPLDQGIVFDGAWRLMSGQVLFRDFAAPNALVPAIMQVPFFWIFGVSWFAFVLHASVVNGLFCVFVYGVLRLCDATAVEATLYAALSAFFFYPPNGTPFMDQHAFFFSALMLGAVAVGSRPRSPEWEKAAWFVVPICFVLAYLSKQIPTAFAAVCVIAWLLLNPRKWTRWLPAALVGVAAIAVTMIVLQLWLQFSPSQAATYLFVMPLDVGAERTTGEGDAAALQMVFGTIRRLPADAHRLSMYLPVAGLAAVAAAARAMPGWRLDGWLLASLFFTTGAFVAYTINQIENAFPLLMLAVGMSSILLRKATAYFVGAPHGVGAATIVAAIVGAVAIGETASFARNVDATRIVLDTEYEPALADRAAPYLPTSLGFMRWTPGEVEPEEFASLVQFLREADGNFALVSDLTPLYPLTGRASVSPALWLHSGLSVPRPDTAAFVTFENELLRRIAAMDVRRVVLSQKTLRGFSLRSFPQLETLVRQRRCGERWFGSIEVVEICRG